jgi:hypothetical protein
MKRLFYKLPTELRILLIAPPVIIIGLPLGILEGAIKGGIRGYLRVAEEIHKGVVKPYLDEKRMKKGKNT